MDRSELKEMIEKLNTAHLFRNDVALWQFCGQVARKMELLIEEIDGKPAAPKPKKKAPAKKARKES